MRQLAPGGPGDADAEADAEADGNAEANADAEADAEADASARPNAGGTAAALRVLDILSRQTAGDSLTSTQLDLARRLVTPTREKADGVAGRELTNAPPREPTGQQDAVRVRSVHEDRWVEALRLPIDVGSAEAARFAEPLLRPMGLRPVFGGGGGGAAMAEAGAGDGGKDGDGGEPDEAGAAGEAGAARAAASPLRPGSPLSVPLIMGDWDAAATGTVTDVLPDGTVLGFGHPMMGMGTTAMPMATGEVHFVMPRQDISFKQSSSRRVVGTLRRDAAAGVAGGAGVDFDTAALRVAVDQVAWSPCNTSTRSWTCRARRPCSRRSRRCRA